jgi:hypothetical protein
MFFGDNKIHNNISHTPQAPALLIFIVQHLRELASKSPKATTTTTITTK